MTNPYLTAILYAPLASFGGLAVGERRNTGRYPTRSQIIGLLGAALGVAREDEHNQARLRDSYSFAVQLFSPGLVGADYHTAQMPSARGKTRFATRRDELHDKRALNTVLTSRDYRFDFLAGLAICAKAGAPYELAELANALRLPHYTLSLGRKSCPLGWPLSPEIVDAATPQAALATLWARIQQDSSARKLVNGLRARPGEMILERDQFDGDPARIEFVRDQPISRRRWQFGLREAVILMPQEVSL